MCTTHFPLVRLLHPFRDVCRFWLVAVHWCKVGGRFSKAPPILFAV
jgi:hypothetical protein